MEIICENRDGKLYIKPQGRLDSTTAGDFEECILSKINDSISSVTIDMADVDFISSKGLRAVVSAYKMLGEGELILDNVNNAVNEVFVMAGMKDVFTINKQ